MTKTHYLLLLGIVLTLSLTVWIGFFRTPTGVGTAVQIEVDEGVHIETPLNIEDSDISTDTPATGE
ncbi:hypothetical protein COU15_03165 [Candidatus Kaiserbacteria bacterium CG10_big_fil_rev_8_21_14_0_10_45_20]|uniref:Uncharacterized protein n=1 Tax=Candidatus Kaiserbacteria bacterium CG10_big_fil_rev_8_21_14_0_10_45_20 TaxID=1974607 RepID=A0A2H0UF09_9BACT|nr:MAG: hypothetical protein COU15_03165 [Candidatus Kaiserbacteria bacterium CG10_big_fil_rev_8_21_14_0_10_45_20]